jgi:ATP-dependent Clp protease adaptor protein ClpS
MGHPGVLEEVDTTVSTKLRSPRRYNVVLFNDDSTTAEFVILLLINIFNKSLDEAQDLTLYIHNNGRGVAGTYSHEVSMQKKEDTINIAQANNSPLRCEIEPI